MRGTAPSTMFLLYLPRANAWKFRAGPVSVGFEYHEIVIRPFSRSSRMSRKGIYRSISCSIVNFRFGCNVFAYGKMYGNSASLALRMMSSTYLPKNFALLVESSLQSQDHTRY